MESLDETGRARLDHGLVAFVECDVADGGHFGRECALGDGGRAQAQVLLRPGIDRDLALVGVATAVGVDRHQHHVHER
jgi:hypothetical protein